MLRRLALSFAFNVVAIFVASAFLDGVDYADDFDVLLIAGLVFAVVNLLVKPVVVLLALPLVILTLGVALFFVNVLMLYLTAWIVPDFELRSFGAAVLAALIVWVVNVSLYAAVPSRRRRR